MGISIEKVRLDDLSIKTDADGKIGFTGNYALVSSKGKVVAKQSFNLYGADVKITPSPLTQAALDKFYELLQGDINILLGLSEPQ